MSIKKVLVTGAAGFIGSHLVDYLLDQGHIVYGVDDFSGGYMRNVNPKSSFTELDLRNREKVEEYIKKIRPELIYHLAADATEGRSQFTPLNCTERTYLNYLYVLVPAIKYGLKKMVYVSSMSVYGAQTPPFDEGYETKPEDIYAIAKSSAEKATEILSSVHGFDYVIIRPHNVYGERQNMADPYRNVAAIFINRLLAGKNFYIYGDGEQKRSFTYVNDCILPLAKSGLDNSVNGEIFNVGPGKESAISIKELSNLILKEFFNPGEIPEKMKPTYLPDRPREVKDAYPNHEKAEKILGYKSETSLRDGIKKMIAWAKKIGYQEPVYLDKIELTSGNIPKTWLDKLI